MKGQEGIEMFNVTVIYMPTSDREVRSDLEVNQSRRQDEDVDVLEPTQLPNTTSARGTKISGDLELIS